MNKISKAEYNTLISSIGNLLEQGRKQAYEAVNSVLVKTYWEIGRKIVEYEQNGKNRAEYGSQLLETIAKDLKLKFGSGFSKSNVYLMRQFYIEYQNFQTVSGKLSWSHYSELLSMDDELSRRFYEKACVQEKWPVRILRRQINSALFQRLALSKNKQEVMKLARKGVVLEKADDIVKDQYIFEFLDIPYKTAYSEKEFEQKIIDNLQMFLLELGTGFTFVKRQYKITLDNTHYYVDLVFYHRILKCFVLVDLKIGKASHSDIGQMNMYLNYFSREENRPEDKEPIGIILSAEKNNFLVEYALGGITNKLFVSKYKLYLPDKKELTKKLNEIIQ